ncbi:hypothetical protein F5141DRAFT_1144912 [Pisolithus sp. B1]|nr:hypothetical protein F5141DRAFT_1144912 [Pisolithus sp. B1]
MQAQDQTRRTVRRQDTFDLRDQIIANETTTPNMHAHADAAHSNAYIAGGASDEEHSVLEDDSDGEERELDYMDEEDDASSSLSIPNESIDFDLVYSLHTFQATVEGQASVVKGDSLFLMDDSNSYWWLVRVLKTQDVGYIPAENIETPFERLARLNKHRNVDLAQPAAQDLQQDVERVRNNLSSRAGSHHSPSPSLGVPAATTSCPGTKSVMFTPSLSVHRYPPAVWNEEEEEEEDVEWEDGEYEEEDSELAEEISIRQRQSQIQDESQHMDVTHMEPDDGMGWDDSVAHEIQASRAQKMKEQQMLMVPDALRSGSTDKQLQQAQEILIAQQRQQEQEQQLLAQQTQALRHQSSKDRLAADAGRTPSPSSPSKTVDPAEATGTRKLSVTPSIAREDQARQGPLLPSAIMQRQEEERKRTREELEALEEASKKKHKGKDKGGATTPTPVSNQPAKASHGGKLRKEHRDTTDDEGKEKKKKGGVFSLFGRKKGKDKDKDKVSIESTSSDTLRESQESGRSSGLQPGLNVDQAAAAPVMQQPQPSLRTSPDVKAPPRQQHQPAPQQLQTQVSQHASQLRQRDQQQQALYQQYLNRSPSSPPEAPSYGLQSAPVVLGNSNLYNTPVASATGLGLGLPSSRPRPGSLVLTPTADGQGVGVPELSVMRLFAGKNVQTEATFKTVLLNASTTTAELVRQAIQRFRLHVGESAADYYLTIKQVEGSSAVLLPDEQPLRVFESLVEAANMELPKVKRSSVGSISSVSSNLSMHPAICKLPMNDFTDDSAVKLYLNKRRNGEEGSPLEEGDETFVAESIRDSTELMMSSGVNVAPDRFSSPNYRFALQLVIYPEDLPDDMVFDPLTEAIVFKNTLLERTSTASISSGVSQSYRRKVFTFPKNVTVAEVIELGLERFGIVDGVVDGGDEVEDKSTNRRSSTKVRYWLTASVRGQERELSPSSRVVDAYTRPPVFKRVQQEGKRRSMDSAQLLGSIEDVSPEDPVFILRRAISYRASTSRHRLSAPLDEIALQHLRDSISGSSVSSDHGNMLSEEVKPKQLSRQEIIAAQRAASREKQRAILSTQANSLRGVDVLLPGNAMIRSSRYDSNEKMRYSYVQDGESFDISDIVEEELRETSGAHKNDLLEGAFDRTKNGMSDRIDRVLTKIKDGRLQLQISTSQSMSSQTDSLPSARSASPSSEYSVDDGPAGRTDGRTPTPLAGRRTTSPIADPGSRGPTPTADGRYSRARSGSSQTTPTSSQAHAIRQPSIASVMSDLSASAYATPTAQLLSPTGSPQNPAMPKLPVKRPYISKDDFGVSQMMAIIEVASRSHRPVEPPLHPVDELLFGKSVEVQSLHPDIREIYSGAFQQLDEMDKTLDEYLQHALTV